MFLIFTPLVCVDMLVATNELFTFGEFLLNETKRALISMYLTILLVCSFLNTVSFLQFCIKTFVTKQIQTIQFY